MPHTLGTTNPTYLLPPRWFPCPYLSTFAHVAPYLVVFSDGKPAHPPRIGQSPSYFNKESWLPGRSPFFIPKIWVEGVLKWSEVKSLSCVRLFVTPWTVSLPGSSVHGILQARLLEWVAISFSRGSSRPRDRTQVSCVAGRHFNLWATREAPGGCTICPQVLQAPGIREQNR